MNILLSYHQKAWQLRGYFPEKYFNALGHQVFLIPKKWLTNWTNWFGRLPFYFPRAIPRSIKYFERLYRVKFDCVIELDGGTLHHLWGLKNFRGPKAYWAIDTQWPFRMHFHKYIEEDFDFIFSWLKDHTTCFKKRPSYWLPAACDPEFHYKMDLPKIYDVVFVGNMDCKMYSRRVELLNNLSVKCKVGAFHNVFGNQSVKLLNQGKIVFNYADNGAFNGRIMEVLACGGFLLTNFVQHGFSEIFEDGKHLVLFKDEIDLHEKVAYYLKHEKEREEIARIGQKEVLQKHTFYHRAQEILEVMKSWQYGLEN